MPSSKPPKATVAPLLSSAIWGVGGIASSGYRLLALDLRQGDVFQSTLKSSLIALDQQPWKLTILEVGQKLSRPVLLQSEQVTCQGQGTRRQALPPIREEKGENTHWRKAI